MSTQTFNVVGMTCAHCVNSITEEVSDVPGVATVDVVLETGILTVAAADDVDAADIKAAVVAAGYTVTD